MTGEFQTGAPGKNKASGLARVMLRRVDILDTCGRCDNIVSIAAKRLRVNPVKLAPVSLPRLLILWMIGKMHGLKYNLPL